LPEHTLEAKVLGHALGADYLEQDLVLTRDGELVVLHDLYLDRVSDVALKFPGRARADGRHYVIDFMLEELRQLDISERRRNDDISDPTLAFTGRFSASQLRFGLNTFAEELELIRALNRTTGKSVGIYPEIKAPSFHHQHGQDISKAVLKVLKEYGYTESDRSVYLQSFDPNELKRLRNELMPSMGMRLPLVQLIARTEWQVTEQKNPNGQWVNYNYDWMLEPDAMQAIAQYADAVAPPISMWIGDTDLDPQNAGQAMASFVKQAHAQGLLVHPFTARADVLPPGFYDIDQLHQWLFDTVGVDGVFTDFPDLTVRYLRH